MKLLSFIAAMALLCGCRPVRPVVHTPVDGPRQPEPVHAADMAEVARRSEPSATPGPAVPVALDPEPILDATELMSELNGQLQDVLFDYDQDTLSPAALTAVRRNAELLHSATSRIAGVRLLIEGHCDERGSAEYNLGLGDRRARRVAAALVELGAAVPNPDLISYGKERPECAEAHESCWRRNRRAHFVVHAPNQD
jgi:peptidoglycan-associated lipoprotein